VQMARVRRTVLALGLAVALSAAAARAADGTLVFQTKDWTFESPAVIGTQADLELVPSEIQLCTDEIKRLVSHRPKNVERFTMRWIIDGARISFALPTGVENHVPSEAWRLIDPGTRWFWEGLVGSGLCSGPHEITHVLTWQSWHMAWANEGFATLTDWLYQSASWRCCTTAIQLAHECDETGYSDGPTHNPYSDLRRFSISSEMYKTAACLWREVLRRGGFPAIRRILMGLRTSPATTPGELVVHHVNPVLGGDFRPIAKRYGFTDHDLVAAGPPPLDPPPPALLVSKPRTSPVPARAGQRVTATVKVARSDTGDSPATLTVRCPARLGIRAANASVRSFANGRATCSWRTPRSARGLSLSASVLVSYRGVSAGRGVPVLLH